MNTEKFWDTYIEKLHGNSVPTKSRRWYVKRAEDYINTHSDIRLTLHNGSTVVEYLEKLGRNYRLTDWQFKQAVDALKILFVDMVKAPWAHSFAWDDWIDSATALSTSHATIARDFDSVDCNSSNLSTSTDTQYNSVRKMYPKHFSKLITIIRVKNYSIRTEQAYENWLARYITFHSAKDPVYLDAHSIGEFLGSCLLIRGVTKCGATTFTKTAYKEILVAQEKTLKYIKKLTVIH